MFMNTSVHYKLMSIMHTPTCLMEVATVRAGWPCPQDLRAELVEKKTFHFNCLYTQ